MATRIPVSVERKETSSSQSHSTTGSRVESTASGGGGGGGGLRMASLEDSMNKRMRDFEDECKHWREEFFTKKMPSLSDRPRMMMDFPESSMASSTKQRCFIEEEADGGRKFKIQYEIGEFHPSEISVKTEGNVLRVRGVKEVVGGGSTERKEFNRETTLPSFVDPVSVTASLSETGYLTVEAPVRAQQQQQSRLHDIPLRGSPARDVLNRSTSRPRAPDTREGTVVDAPDGTQMLRYAFNLSEFLPEDITISVTDQTLRVHALHEEKSASGTTYREFRRELGLPERADARNLRNRLAPDGTLFIEVPLPLRSSPGIVKMAAPSQEQVSFGQHELRLTFDLAGYSPEDINVKLTDNVLRVTAVHIDNTDGNQIHREYSREYILPAGVNKEGIRSVLDQDTGELIVEVPLTLPQDSDKDRVVRISAAK